MEQKRSIWKETLNYGIIMGLINVGVSVLAYMFDLSLKTWVLWPSLLISILVLFFLLRSYRDHYNFGYISYGRSVGAGVIISIYAAIITSIYIYVLYAFIDPGLIDKTLALTEAKMVAQGNVPEMAIEKAMEFQAKMMKPWLTALIGMFSGVFSGLILSLIVSLFIMKKGNPLLDELEAEPKV